MTVSKFYFIGFICSFLQLGLFAQNPILKGKGVCDPQIRIYNNNAYLYATHDSAAKSKTFIMNDWWIWSSSDLVNWNYETTLKPENTYFKKATNQCWATDAISRNGKYYLYFSRGPKEIGVMESDSPIGPWKDPIQKPLIALNSTPTEARDPGILQLADGTSYIVFGVWDFYIARLNPDMVSLAETPRKITLDKKNGPYGAGKTDDKPFLHQRGNKFYLSWGCYYAMADNPYGPYNYKGSIITKERTDTLFQKRLTYDRHGSFFKLHNQWYFACNDQSVPGSDNHFRNSVISYVHYRDNGEIAPIYLSKTGVGQYEASLIQAEDYFSASKVNQQENADGGFSVSAIPSEAYLYYPKVKNLGKNAKVSLRISSVGSVNCTINVRENNIQGKLLGKHKLLLKNPEIGKTISFDLKNSTGDKNICLQFKGDPNSLKVDWFSFDESLDFR
nr:family 43 glycosylhydrolase [uncultured Pedobacter sp.]